MKAKRLFEFLGTEAEHLQQAGLLRSEAVVGSPPGPTVTLGGRELLNLASSDYLGLSTHAELKRAAKAAVDEWGVGLAAPRLLAGTLKLHLDLEKALAGFLGVEDAVALPTGYHANTCLFESLFSDRDFLFCDEQLDPSLADGVRLCRARVYPYRSQDLEHLEDRLKRSRAARFRGIVTSGFFAATGELSALGGLYALADRYDATVFVDDAQAVGVLGGRGRGSHEALGLEKRLDVVTGSFEHALGGGAAGYVGGRKELIAWLRQKSRPYLSSSALAPAAAATAARALELVQKDPAPRQALAENVRLFRAGLAEQGLSLAAGEHPAVSVRVGDALLAQRMTDLLYRKGVFAMGFCYPVVPEGAARLRAQVTARHSQKALKNAAAAFGEAAREVGLAAKPPA